jgi:type IV pilus assembly protein PilW
MNCQVLNMKRCDIKKISCVQKVTSLSLQRGLSLVELMVAVGMGLLILLAVSSVFLSTVKTDKTQEALSRIQENASYVAEVVGGAARRAGFRANPQMALAQCDDANVGFPAATVGGFSFLGCEFIRANTSNAVDSFAIRYQGAMDGLSRDCTGAAVAAGALTTEIWDLSGGNLRCAVNGGSANTMVENIGNIRFEYGINTQGVADRQRGVDAYVSPASVPDWINVAALRMEVMLQSARDVNTQVQPYRFNGVTVTPADLKLRKTYVTTFRVRN